MIIELIIWFYFFVNILLTIMIFTSDNINSTTFPIERKYHITVFGMLKKVDADFYIPKDYVHTFLLGIFLILGEWIKERREVE